MGCFPSFANFPSLKEGESPEATGLEYEYILLYSKIYWLSVQVYVHNYIIYSNISTVIILERLLSERMSHSQNLQLPKTLYLFSNYI